MKKILIVLVLVMFINKGVWGEEQQQLERSSTGRYSFTPQYSDDVALIIYGIGVESCGKYVTDYRENDWPKFVNISWIQGYLTGKTTLTNKPYDVDALGIWVFNYCIKNPLHTQHKATVELYKELAEIN